jgi:hypothetical protein
MTNLGEYCFSAISWREQVTFWWVDDVCLVLDQHADLDFHRLAHWNNSTRVDMPTRIHYSDSEPASLCSYSLMLVLNFTVFDLTWRALNPRSTTTRGEHANYYTTDVATNMSCNTCVLRIFLFQSCTSKTNTCT